jgi:hypothetical protein
VDRRFVRSNHPTAVKGVPPMKNPLRELSRSKALGIAGIVAGAVAVSGAAAALNVGLLTGHESSPFTPQSVASTDDGAVTTTSTTEPPVEIVYQDVYEPGPASAPATPGAPVASSSRDDDNDDSYGDDADDADEDGTYEDDADEDDDHEDEDDHEVEDDDFDD